MKTSRMVLLAAAAAALLAFGCSEDNSNGNSASENQQQQLTARERRIEEVKTQVRAIAGEATDRFDFDDGRFDLRVRLEPLLAELRSLNETTGSDEVAAKITGVWHQVWSDFQAGKTGQGPLADQVYQVVLPGGNLWNIGLVEYGPLRRTELLRAGYIVGGVHYDFTYTKAVYLTQWLAVGTDLQVLAMQAETGKFDVNMIVYQEGESPLGRKASLEHLYIDDDFRVCRSTPDPETGMFAIFIFERVPAVADSPEI